MAVITQPQGPATGNKPLVNAPFANKPVGNAPLADVLAEFQDEPETTRASSSSRTLVIVGVAIGAIGLLGLTAMGVANSMGGDEGPEVLPHVVSKGDLLVTVTGKAVLESAKNVNLKCQVDGGAKILWIVEDGKRVEKGEELVKLDDSTLKTQIQTQEIALERAAAVKKQAEEDYKVAVKAVEEYRDGTFIKELQTLEAAVIIAQENESGAKNSLEHSRRMHRKGYISDLQLDAQVFAVKRTGLELASAETAVRVLKDFTKVKMLTTLESARDAAEIKMKSEDKAYKLEQTKLEDLIAQRKQCVIVAPHEGIVVHANDRGERRGGQQALRVEEGATVNARQDIIRMPDLTQMQAKAMINETKIEKVAAGMRASIRLFDGRTYQGTVTSIANSSDQKNWFSSDVREYAVIVELEGLKDTLKPGMTAEVEILTAHKQDVLQVPITSIVQLEGGPCAWVKTGKGLEKRPLKLAMENDKLVANDKAAQVLDGLNAGEEVVLNPRAVIEEARHELQRVTNVAKRFGTAKQPAEGDIANEGAPTKKKNAKPRATGGGGDFLGNLDADKDGKISRAEAEGKFRGFEAADIDRDGFLNATEIAASVKAWQSKQAGGGGGGIGGPSAKAAPAPNP